MKISIDDAVDQKLRNLVTILLDEGYFAMLENALAYIQDIYRFIDTIPGRALRHIRKTDPLLYYCQYKLNKRTTWYIVYEIEGDDYLIRNVFNNHSAEYVEFIAGLK